MNATEFHEIKKIGSFEAKTNLSSILREVEEKGTIFHITRRGKQVAVLKRDDAPIRVDPMMALERLRTINIGNSVEEIIDLRDDGRER